jgi:hypothetical protein
VIIYVVSKDTRKVIWDASGGFFQRPVEVSELL